MGEQILVFSSPEKILEFLCSHKYPGYSPTSLAETIRENTSLHAQWFPWWRISEEYLRFSDISGFFFMNQSADQGRKYHSFFCSLRKTFCDNVPELCWLLDRSCKENKKEKLFYLDKCTYLHKQRTLTTVIQPKLFKCFQRPSGSDTNEHSPTPVDQ